MSLWPLIATFYKISGHMTFMAPDPSYLDHEPLISGSPLINSHNIQKGIVIGIG